MSALATDMPSSLMAPSNNGIRQADLAVFQQRWWVEIAKGNADYRELQVRTDDTVVGSLAFILVRNRIGNRLGYPPIWSHLGGPVVSQAVDREKRPEIIRGLMAQLPNNISFKFVCDPAATDADIIKQEFEEAGFIHSTETTYLQYPEDMGVLARLSGESKRQIVSAPKKLRVIDIGADEFIAFYQANLATAGKQCYAPMQIARDLIVRGQQGDALQVRVIAARQASEDSLLDAAIAFAWDHKRYYLWMVTHRHSLRDGSQPKPHPHAGKLLIFEGTEDARRRGLIFDADGATTRGNETLYRDRLKFPRAEYRDVFHRDTKLHRLYKQIKPRIRPLG
ncbi:MAG: hypothetical protein ABR910_04665 [Acidobacteriaceae bacterium]|jgi:hypothetical protein